MSKITAEDTINTAPVFGGHGLSHKLSQSEINSCGKYYLPSIILVIIQYIILLFLLSWFVWVWNFEMSMYLPNLNVKVEQLFSSFQTLNIILQKVPFFSDQQYLYLATIILGCQKATLKKVELVKLQLPWLLGERCFKEKKTNCLHKQNGESMDNMSNLYAKCRM